MTAEDAYWHACTGTPIPLELPTVLEHGPLFVECGPELGYYFVFEDGIRVTLDRADQLDCRRGRGDLERLVRAKYLAAVEGASGDPTAGT